MIPKWSSKFELRPGKWVFIPTPDMVNTGREIKTAIERRWRPPPFFYHLRAGGHVAALRAHVGSKAFLRLDIQDFFGSVSRSRVARSLTGRFSRATALEWAHASTVRNPLGGKRTIVPFGFVQSPIVASLCLADSALGRCLSGLSKTRKVKVSVYVDDIILSSKNKDALGEELLEQLARVAQRSRFAFSPDKTQGPGAMIKAFNIELCRGLLRIEDGRMGKFIHALKSAESAQRVGIIGYIGSVNTDQESEARKVA